MKLWDSLREPIRDKDGACLPASRLDLVLCVPVTIAAMASVVFISEPFSISNVLKCAAFALVCVLLVFVSTYRRSVLGVAAAIVGLRAIVGSVIFHQWTIAAAGIPFCIVALLLLRRLEPPR